MKIGRTLGIGAWVRKLSPHRLGGGSPVLVGLCYVLLAVAASALLLVTTIILSPFYYCCVALARLLCESESRGADSLCDLELNHVTPRAGTIHLDARKNPMHHAARIRMPPVGLGRKAEG